MAKGTIRERVSMIYLKFLIYVAGVFSSSIALLFILHQAFKSRIILRSKSKSLQPTILDQSIYGVHKYAQLKDIKLHYVENGDQTKPLILFVHGFNEFWFTWREQIKYYSAHFRTVAVDLRGYGHSEKPPGIYSYELNTIIEDLKNLIEYLGTRKVILVGCGWGGLIVHCFVHKHPDLTEKYITLGAVPPYTFSLGIRQLIKLWFIYFCQLPLLPEYYLRIYDMNLIFSDELQDESTLEIVQAYTDMCITPGFLTCAINHYRANTSKLGLQALFGVPKVAPEEFPPGLLIQFKEDTTVDKLSYTNARNVTNLITEKVDYSSNILFLKESSVLHKLIDQFVDSKSLSSIGEVIDHDDEGYPLVGDIR